MTKKGQFAGYHLPVGDTESIDSLRSSRLVRKEAGIEGLAIQFHTHPRGNRTPTGTPGSAQGDGDFAVMNKLDLDTNSRPAAPYGIIKYGPNVGDVTVYDRKGVISPKDYDKSIGCFSNPGEIL